MYHIKDDLRSQKTAQKIYRSIRRILWTKPLSEITITDIKNDCGVSRSSFYRNFDNILDPMTMKLDQFIQDYMEQSAAIDVNDHILFFFEYWNYHSDFITILSTQGYGYIIMESFKKVTPDINKYDIAVKISIMSTLLITWNKNKKKESPQKMAEITYDILHSDSLLF